MCEFVKATAKRPTTLVREGCVIDWRTEFGRLAPFLESRGGVVAVRTTANAPASIFARTLRTVMQQSESTSWKAVQIEPSNSNTHYLSEILLQMHRSFEIALRKPTTREAAPVAIVSGIDAGSM